MLLKGSSQLFFNLLIFRETDGTEFKMTLTPEMVKAEFPQIGQTLSEESKEKSAKEER